MSTCASAVRRVLAGPEEIPFGPRKLSKAELLRRDIYFFGSPKLGREVMVTEAAGLAMALEFEFAPEVAHYVERPRRLRVAEQAWELSFWTRTQRGREQFHLLTHFSEVLAGQKRAAQNARQGLVGAAQQAQISLNLVPAQGYLQQAMANVNRLRVLPYVQTALAMPALNTLTARVEELFRIQTKMSFARIEQNLPEFKASEVRAATCVLIHRGTLGIDWTARLHDHAPIERKEDA